MQTTKNREKTRKESFELRSKTKRNGCLQWFIEKVETIFIIGHRYVIYKQIYGGFMEKQKGNKKTYISIRLNIMFLCIFLLFSAIIVQLGKVQIVEGEAYKNQVENNQNTTTSIPVPRGQILDREGKTVVNNKSLRTITYTRVKGITSEAILKTAKDLAKVLEMPEQDINKLTDIDKKDFWMQLNTKRAETMITKKDIEKFKEKGIEGKELDKKIEELRRSRVTEVELAELTAQDLKVLAIKSKMNSGYQLTPQIIKKDVTNQEYAQISENLAEFPGVDATVDWERNYVNGDLFRSVLGNITSRVNVPLTQKLKERMTCYNYSAFGFF